jgi:hypothetical protein
MAHLLSKARAGARVGGDRNEKKGAEAEVDEIKHALLSLSVSNGKMALTPSRVHSKRGVQV